MAADLLCRLRIGPHHYGEDSPFLLAGPATSAAIVDLGYCGKQYPNATSSFSGPSSRIFRRNNAHTMFFSFLRKPIHVCESAETCRSGWPICPSYTLTFWSMITTVACRCSLPVKVKWKVAFNPADLPG